MDEFHRIGFLGVGRTASTLAPAISIVDSNLFVSVSAFTEPIGSSLREGANAD